MKNMVKTMPLLVVLGCDTIEVCDPWWDCTSSTDGAASGDEGHQFSPQKILPGQDPCVIAGDSLGLSYETVPFASLIHDEYKGFPAHEAGAIYSTGVAQWAHQGPKLEAHGVRLGTMPEGSVGFWVAVDEEHVSAWAATRGTLLSTTELIDVGGSNGVRCLMGDAEPFNNEGSKVGPRLVLTDEWYPSVGLGKVYGLLDGPAPSSYATPLPWEQDSEVISLHYTTLQQSSWAIVGGWCVHAGGGDSTG